MNISRKTFNIILKKINSQEPTTNTLSAIRRARRSYRDTEGMVSLINMLMGMIMAIILWDSFQHNLVSKSLKISICRKEFNNLTLKELNKVAKCKTVKCRGKAHSQML